jgi:DNA-binding transcriptional MerR regulator
VSESRLSIGALSLRARCNVPTIRYYEQIGLLPPAQRSPNGHRHYREADLRRLILIKRCRDFGFTIEHVKQLVGLFENGDRACLEVRDLAQKHLDQVRAKMKELREFEHGLAEFVGNCTATCAGGTTRDCVVLEELAKTCAAPANQATCCAPTSSKNGSTLKEVSN